MRPLVTPRCTLEPQVAAHAAEMFRVLSDPVIYEFENEPPQSEAWLHERFVALERRASADGMQAWLNWVIRLPSNELAGYVQATVLRSGVAYVAYELASRHWRQGIASAALGAVLAELNNRHEVNLFVAVLKTANFRSAGLLRSLGFAEAASEQAAEHGAARDETVMVKSVDVERNAA